MKDIIIIAAVAENNVIGKDGKIPWHIKEDFQHFKEITMGWPCIMGDKTYESLPIKPLPGRENIILTFNKNYHPEGTVVKYSFKEALDHCKNNEKVFIIGGASIYKQGLNFANKMELTRIHKSYDGDTYFPEFNENEWIVEKKEDHDGFSFITYVKKEGN
jgi:dihydrofolate reductase